MTIQELKPDLMKDWFDFFDHRAFGDHEEWRGCYCTAFYYPKPAEYSSQSNKRRDYAAWLIETGRLRGYMAYEDGRVVGWVNTNDRTKFPRLNPAAEGEEKILSIVCFIVEKEHRGKGIAKAMLNKVVEEAKGRGYSAIEAYPKKRAKSEFGRWNGPFEMYQSAGFLEAGTDQNKAVRKHL